jgi:predicted phosphoadenosine phosphosulfate sulfurtransferase
MKTQALKQALDKYGFDAAFGGARRDEEKSRAKERVFSFRNATHSWDPKNQRPEMWNIYNTRIQAGESIRVFPLSNWTEADIWHYIHQEISRLYRCILQHPVRWLSAIICSFSPMMSDCNYARVKKSKLVWCGSERWVVIR